MEFTFDTITFFSNFDSGNLANVEKLPQKILKPEEEFWDTEFNLWTKPDAGGTTFENLNRTWFYFGVSGVPANLCMKINIVNLNKQGKLFSQGYAPVYKTVPSGKETWERVKEKIAYEQNNSEFNLSFTHTFNMANSTTYFAFAYPWSYTECQEKLNDLDKKFSYCLDLEQNSINFKTIYYYRELLCYSPEGYNVDLITVSDCSGVTEDIEPRFDKRLFPDQSKPRCKDFLSKKVFFLTSRVHPGETPSSHVFNGFLDFILKEGDARAEQLRKKYVFKLIPMLNPDGVARGHYRTDKMGVNLNRVYLDPTYELYPSIYAAKSLLVYYHCRHTSLWQSLAESHELINVEKKGTPEHLQKFMDFVENMPGSQEYDFKKFPTNTISTTASQTPIDDQSTKTTDKKPISYFVNLFSINSEITTPHLCDPRLLDISHRESGVAFYIDLHAHASKKGCFFYGNCLKDQDKQIECLTYAKLVSLNSSHLDFSNCNFSERNMYAPDKRENSTKEGSGRVAIYKHLGILHCYTLECNYNTGRIVNHIPFAVGDKGRATPPLPMGAIPQKYTIAHFEEVGRALAVAALDITDSNPWSRIIQSDFINSNGVREFLRRTHPMMRAHTTGKAQTSTSVQQLPSPSSPQNVLPGKSSSLLKNSSKYSASAPPYTGSRTISQRSSKHSPSNHKSADFNFGKNSQSSKLKTSRHVANK